MSNVSKIDLSKSVNLFQGDCLEVMKGIPDGSVDLILTEAVYELNGLLIVIGKGGLV